MVNILTVSSESCDHYGPYLFKRKLSDTQLLAWLEKNIPGECDIDNEPGPGFMGTYLYPVWTKAEIQ